MRRFKSRVVQVLDIFSYLRLTLTKDRRKYIAQLEETLTKQQIVQQDLDEKQTILLAEVESENVRLYYTI